MILLYSPFALFINKRIIAKNLPRDIATREDEEEEILEVKGGKTNQPKDQI